jgi:hypothetical protein
MRIVASVLMLALSLQSQNISKPHVAPFFDRIDDSPAFFVDCLNTSNEKVSSASSVWPIRTGSVRVDGSMIDFGNMIGPGLSTDVRPGQPWRGIIVLRQSPTQYFPAVRFGAMVRTTLVHTLAPGKHTIAVQCEGSWSDEFDFYWEQEAK